MIANDPYKNNYWSPQSDTLASLTDTISSSNLVYFKD